MQLLVEAREHINRYEFSQAIEKCKLVLAENENSDQAYELILEILGASQDSEYQKYLQEYLLYLNANKEFEKFYLYFKKIDVSNVEIKIAGRLDFINILWELGRLSEFYSECEKLYSICVDQKYFNKLESVINHIENISKKPTYILRGKIILYSELGESEKLLKAIKEFELEYIYSVQNWSEVNLRETRAIRDILGIYKDDFPFILKEYMRFEIYIQLMGKIDEKIPTKNILEFILLSNTDEDFFLAFERENHLIVEDAIGTYIKFKMNSKLNKIPHVFHKTRKLFSSKITMAMVEIQVPDPENNSDTIEIPESYELRDETIIEAQVHTRRMALISNLEKELILDLKYEEYSQEVLNNLIVGFIEMELYFTALNLVSKLEESTNKLYLRAQIELNLRNFPEVIVAVNDAYTQYHLDNSESVPFDYLKAKAFENIGQKNKAHEIYQKIASIDPGFMEIGGKLR